MDRILPFFDPPPLRGQKQTFFDPLPPHFVHVVIEWPLIYILLLRTIKTNLHIVGLCAARHLANQKNLIPVVYEQSSDIGGTWVYNDKVGKDENGMPIHSSMYKSLKTNLPKEVMAFPDFPFPSDETESFLHHTQGNLLRGIVIWSGAD